MDVDLMKSLATYSLLDRIRAKGYSAATLRKLAEYHRTVTRDRTQADVLAFEAEAQEVAMKVRQYRLGEAWRLNL